MSLSVAQCAETLKTQGAVTVEGLFSPREMATFRCLIDRTLQDASAVETYKGRPTSHLLIRAKDTVWHIWEFYAVCEGALRFTRHPAIVQILEATLGESVTYASNGNLFDKVAGGGTEIAWHQDAYFVLDPPPGTVVDPKTHWQQFGHVHVRATEMDFAEDYYRSSLVVRINIDPQTRENGCLRVIPGSHLEGPFEVKGGLEQYVREHEVEAIDCVAGEGSVTFHYPTVLHSSVKNALSQGAHRRAAAHRVRRSSLRIPGWEWPTTWEMPSGPVTSESSFDLNPLAS